MSAPTRVIVDASALLDALDRDHPEHAVTLTDLASRFDVASPTLLAWEVANVVHRKAPERFGATPEARADLVRLLLDGIALVAPAGPDDVAAAGALAEKHRISAYDAAYLALARSADALLVTHDAALHAAGKRELGTARALRFAEARVALDEGRL